MYKAISAVSSLKWEKTEFVSDLLCDTAKTLKTYKERNEIYIFNVYYELH